MNNINEEVSKLGNIQDWNHNFVLPGNIETNPGKQTSHGKNLVKLERLKPIFEKIGLDKKNVLDMGCNEGFFSQYLASNGSRVQGIDIDENRIEKAKYVKKIIGNDLDINFKNGYLFKGLYEFRQI